MPKTSMEVHEHARKLEKQKELEQKELKERILKEELIPVSISPMYRQRLGANLPLTVGVETVTIPVDGQVYSIKKPFAEVLRAHIHQIDNEEIRGQGRWRGNRGDVSPTGPIPGKN